MASTIESLLYVSIYEMPIDGTLSNLFQLIKLRRQYEFRFKMKRQKQSKI